MQPQSEFFSQHLSRACIRQAALLDEKRSLSLSNYAGGLKYIFVSGLCRRIGGSAPPPQGPAG